MTSKGTQTPEGPLCHAQSTRGNKCAETWPIGPWPWKLLLGTVQGSCSGISCRDTEEVVRPCCGLADPVNTCILIPAVLQLFCEVQGPCSIQKNKKVHMKWALGVGWTLTKQTFWPPWENKTAEGKEDKLPLGKGQLCHVRDNSYRAHHRIPTPPWVSPPSSWAMWPSNKAVSLQRITKLHWKYILYLLSAGPTTAFCGLRQQEFLCSTLNLSAGTDFTIYGPLYVNSFERCHLSNKPW